MSRYPQVEMTRYRSSGRRPRRKRRLWWLLALVVVLGLAVAAGTIEAERSSQRSPVSARHTTRPQVKRSAAAVPVATVFRVAKVPALRAHISSILAAEGFAGATSGLSVVDLSTAASLDGLHNRAQLVPASNEKLVTSAAALAGWGAAYRFRTELLTKGTFDKQDGVFKGRLYLKGFGDPSLSTTAFRAHGLHLKTATLAGFVTALRKAGFRKIVGGLVGDDSYFDSIRTVGSWRSGMTSYCGPLSALCLNEDIRADGRRASDPPLYVAAQLTALLRQAGISVSRPAAHGITPATATLLYTARSAPVARLLAAMNKPSDDFFAETLTKGLGASFAGAGTTAAGLGVERAFLVAQGIRAGSFRLTDGSGLSYRDRLTAFDITTLLAAMSRRADWHVFWNSLPEAGVSGTLAGRMRGTPAQKNLRAKTGTLNVASSLSGYVTSRNGQWLAFSMLMNNRHWVDLAAAHAAQDAVGVALARSRPPGTIVWTPAARS